LRHSCCRRIGNCRDETLFDWHAQRPTRASSSRHPVALPGGEQPAPRGRDELHVTGTLFSACVRERTELYFNPEAVRANPFSGLHGLGGFANANSSGVGATLKLTGSAVLRHA